MKQAILLGFLLTTALGYGQTSPTNAPDSNILVPTPFVPTVTVPQLTPVTIPSANEIAPPPPRPTAPTTTPFGRQVGVLPPTVRDIASGNVRLVPPPLPALTAAVVALPADANSGENVTPTGGKYRHVAPTGSDSNPGTSTQPWKTIQHAAQAVEPGDVVVIQRGTYEAFHTVHSGEPNRPITFRALAEVIIIPAGGASPTETQASTMQDIYRLDNIHVRNTDYVIIEGFHVQRAGRCGISVIESRGVILRQNIIGPVGRFGILTGFATEVQIISNKTFGAAAEHGIYVSNSRVPNDKPVIRANESYENRQNGIQVNGDCGSGGDGSITGAIIEGNLVHHNGLKGLSLISMSDSIVQNNVIYENAKTAGAGGIHLTDELTCGRASSGNIVVNNTVIEPRMACIRLTDGAQKNILFNNLLIGNRPLVDEVEDNFIDKDSNVRLDSTLGVFHNIDAGSFRPLATSPAKGAGVLSYREVSAPLVDRDGQRRRAAFGLDAGAY